MSTTEVRVSLTSRASVAWDVLTIAAWPVVAATIVRYALGHAVSLTADMRTLFGAAVLLPTVCLHPALRGKTALDGASRPFMVQALVAIGGFVVFATLLSRPPPLVPGEAMVTLVPAAVEEFVFRWMLPVSLMSVLGRSTSQRHTILLSAILAQASFALAHMTSFSGNAFLISEFLRLLAGGILYAAIVDEAGLGLATAVHAAMNYTLGYALDFYVPWAVKTSSVLFSILGMLLIWTNTSSSRGQYSRIADQVRRYNESP